MLGDCCSLSWRRRWSLAVVCVAAWLSAGGALAAASEADLEPGAFSLGGFGSLGLARSSNGNAEYLRSVTQPRGIRDEWTARNDSVLGVQTTIRLGESLKAVAQAVVQYRNDASYSPELTRAFISYDLSPRLTLRAGRIDTEFLIGADSRLVGYSYLPVRPTVDFFGVVPIKYGDGIDARLGWPLDEGVLRADLFAGVGRERLPAYDLNDSKMLKSSVGYDRGPWKFRYTYAQARLSHNIPWLDPLRATLIQLGAGAAARGLELADTTSRYHSFGAGYDDGVWQVQASVNKILNESQLIQDQGAGYVLVGRRVGSLNPFLGYSRVKSTPNALATGLPNPMFQALNSAVAQALAVMHADRHTWSLGVRWDCLRNMDVKLQADLVRGDRSSLLLLNNNPTPTNWSGRTTVLTLMFDFVF